jgi:hypothetical protein
VLLLWGAIAVIGRSIWSVLRDPTVGPVARPLLAGLLAATAAFSFWVLYGTRYGFVGRALHVRSGPFRWRVPLASIDHVRPTRNPLSAPAPSLDRLEVRYKERRRYILISPADKGGFLRALVARAPHLRVEGDEAVRVEEDA